jgi:hypothetical protein
MTDGRTASGFAGEGPGRVAEYRENRAEYRKIAMMTELMPMPVAVWTEMRLCLLSTALLL